MTTQSEMLVVEDDPNDLELIMRSLKKVSLAERVAVARDGEEALDYLFREGPWAGVPQAALPKIVLMDLKLPKLDGLEVISRMKEDPRTSAIPIAVLSSSTERSDVSECYRLRVNSYIVKPSTFDRFADAVGQVGTYWLAVNYAPPSVEE